MIGKAWGGLILVGALTMLAFSFFGYEIPDVLLWIEGALILVGGGVFVFFEGMTLMVLRRVIEAIFTLWIIASLTFVLLRVLPGGPFDSEKALPPEVVANLAKTYHLDEPLFKQYTAYLGGLLHGDLGQSYKYVGRGITSIIMESFPTSVQLGVYALIVAYVLGIPAGVLAGWKRGTWLDFSAMFLAISGVSLPSFLMAPIFIMVFAFKLHWLEPALWEGPTYYILPSVVLGIRPAALIARLTRASVLEVIHADYVRTARAKGLSKMKVLFKHILRNSLIPVLTLSGPLAAGILTGSFVIEQIFAVPGIAKHLILSVSNRDYPLILGTTLLFSVMLVVANLVADLVIAVIDPRVRMQ